MLLELVTVDLDLNLGFFLPEPSVMVLIHSIFLPLPRHGLQPTRFLCPLLSPEVCLNSCPLSLWFCLTILSSTTSFSSCLQSFPASGSFPGSQLFTSGGQSIGAFNLSISPSNEYSELNSFRINSLDILAVQGLSRVFSSITVWKHQFSSAQHS